MLALLAKEWMEIRRTWRIWVLPGLLLSFGVTAPPLARLTPALVRSFASDQPGVLIQLPEPVALDGYLQFTKSLTQIVVIALIIASADLIAGERRSGTCLLVLTKPVSRTAFVLSKVVAQCALVATATVIAGVACWVGTRALFDTGPVWPLIKATLIWLLLAGFVIAVMTLLSVVMRAQAGAAGIGLAIYVGLILLGQWEPTQRFTPGGLFATIDAAISGEPVRAAGPVISAAVLGLVALFLAIRGFQRTEFTGGTS